MEIVQLTVLVAVYTSIKWAMLWMAVPLKETSLMEALQEQYIMVVLIKHSVYPIQISSVITEHSEEQWHHTLQELLVQWIIATSARIQRILPVVQSSQDLQQM